jgi:hypothetical protein
LFDRLDNCSVMATMIGDQVEFTVDSTPVLPMVDEQGYIVVDNPSV